MGLTARQLRVLESMEERLRAREPRLVSMFSLFTRLTQDEAIPATEAVSIGRWRYLTGGPTVRKRPGLPVVRWMGTALVPLMLISVISAVLAVAGLGAPPGQCTATVSRYSASQIAFPQGGCASRSSRLTTGSELSTR
jgi:hypothetical protein